MWGCLFHITLSAWLIICVLAYDYEGGGEIEDEVCADQYENVSTQHINIDFILLYF